MKKITLKLSTKKVQQIAKTLKIKMENQHRKNK